MIGRLWRRRTIRTRLTLIYAGLFLAGGTALIAAITGPLYHELRGGPHHGESGSGGGPGPGDHDELRDATASHLLHHALELLVVVVVLSALVGWWLAGRMLRRISAITTAARRAGENNLHERLNLPGPDDELKKLADTFDSMLERLDAAFAAQKRFVANASHELRTPLAVTRTAVEVTLGKPEATETQWREMAADVARSTGRAQALIDGLLMLARSQERLGDVEDDDLADLAAEALDLVRPAARARELRVETWLDPAPVRGNLALLGRAVANLVENAVKYNTDGGRLVVRTSPTRLVVENDGPHLEPGDVGPLFEPFHRGSNTRGAQEGSGVGLGLSIVQAVVTAHGGEVTAEPRPEGGLRVEVRLPG
jgi:signal transduction histidine kinase